MSALRDLRPAEQRGVCPVCDHRNDHPWVELGCDECGAGIAARGELFALEVRVYEVMTLICSRRSAPYPQFGWCRAQDGTHELYRVTEFGGTADLIASVCSIDALLAARRLLGGPS